jgi:LDH2 family malate/lactate/ureidoglycolate dehydrogenase
MSKIIVNHVDLQSFATRIFEKLGLPIADATLVANALVKSNLRGQDGHGGWNAIECGSS